LINKAYRGADAMKGWATESHLLDGLRIDEQTLTEYIQNKGTVFFKCSVDSEIIGSVQLNLTDTGVYFGMLTVNPYKQNTGTGKLLLKHIELFAKEHNSNRIYMTVITVRDELIAWYERHGYVRTGETEPFPTDTKFGIPKQPLQLMVMEKHIDIS
jgi:N-acetylglutamate synthase-like GNAT family acetyltransferase